MSLGFEILILIIGAMLAGLNGCIVFILSDFRNLVRKVSDKLDSHVTDKTLHTECGKVHP